MRRSGISGRLSFSPPIWSSFWTTAICGRLSNLFIDGQCDCRNQDGIDLRVGCSNIIIENITGQSGDDIIALSAIGNRENSTNPTYMYRVEGHDEDIHATNLHMYKGSVIVANVALENCYFGNIYAENDVDHILTTMDDRDTALKGAQMRNVVFENIFYRNFDNDHAVAFDLPLSEEIGHYRIDGLFIKNAFLGNCRNIFNIGHCGQINYRDIYGTFVEKTDGISEK